MCFRRTGEGAALFLARLAAGQCGFRSHQIGRTLHHLYAVLLIPLQLISRWAGTLVAAQCVHTAELTAATVYTAFINVSTVSYSVQDVAFVAVTLKAAWRIHTGVVTCPIKGALVYILTGPLVGQQFVAFLAAALKASHCVPADVITAAIAHATLINIFACLAIRLESKSDWTAAANSC